MRIRILESHARASVTAARIVGDLVRSRPRAVLGLATGSTPTDLYRELVRMHREEGLDFRKVTTFNLDEYVGLPPDHPGSYHRYMRERLFEPLAVPPRRTNLPSGTAKDLGAECRRYERRIASRGGIDLQILGIGTDGHIGFNEPGTSLGSRTNVQTLSPTTIRDNAGDFGDRGEVPVHAITMGIATILAARRILVLATGGRKAACVAAAIEGPLCASHTASALQLHADTTWLLDREAAAELRDREYYLWMQEQEDRDPSGPAAVLPR